MAVVFVQVATKLAYTRHELHEVQANLWVKDLINYQDKSFAIVECIPCTWPSEPYENLLATI